MRFLINDNLYNSWSEYFRMSEFEIWGGGVYISRCTKSTEWIWPKLTEKQAYESLQPLRSKSRKCSVRFYVVAITRFRNSPNFQQRSWFTFPFFATFLDELLSSIRKSRQSCMNDCVKSTVPVSRFWFLSLDPLINLPFRKSNQNRLGRFRACRNFRFHPSTFETEFRDFKIHLINYTNFRLSKISEFWSKIAARVINYLPRTYTSSI